MSKPITFTLHIHEVLDLPCLPNDWSFQQELIRYMRDEKGLVCKGSVHIIPVGEVTWFTDPETKGVMYTQYLDR